MMGISNSEKVVNNVTAILKTLECSICLELLQTPVSTGCGHFFCRFCITETLQLNYRKPCPLCKKSFTRRGIQDATHRQTIIKAAKNLAEVCAQVTGINFFPKGNQNETVKNTSDIKTTESTPKKQDKIKTSYSRKRKSNEIEDNDKAKKDKVITLPENRKLEYQEEEKCTTISTDEVTSFSKRYCHDPNDDSECELPSLDNLFTPKLKQKDKQVNASKPREKPCPIVSVEKLTDIEKYLIPTDSLLTNNLKKNRKSCEVALAEESHTENEDKDSKRLNVRRKAARNLLKSRNQVFFKNKKNALKNKTNLINEIASEDGCNTSKIVKGNPSTFDFTEENIADEELSKENKRLSVNCSESPVKRSKPRKKRKREKSRVEKNDPKSESYSSAEENMVKELEEAEHFPLLIENKTCTSLKKNNERECFDLSETKIPITENIETVGNNSSRESVEQELKSDYITDTAVSVQSVASPQISKSVLSHKSPGWSRVKKVGKDFRVKKFSRLPVEKNTSRSNSPDMINVGEDIFSEVPEEQIKFIKISDAVRIGEQFDKKQSNEPQNKKEFISEDLIKNDHPKKNNSNGEQPEKVTNEDNFVISNDKDIITNNQESTLQIINTDSETAKKSEAYDKDLDYIPKVCVDHSKQHETKLKSISIDNADTYEATTKKNSTNILIQNISNNADYFENNMCDADNDNPNSAQKNLSSATTEQMDIDGINYENDEQIVSKSVDCNTCEFELENTANVEQFPLNAQHLEKQMLLSTTENKVQHSKEFPKPQISSLIKESRISKISKVSKQNNIDPESDKLEEDVFYIEHSQQTSQRLVDIYDAKHQKFQLTMAAPFQFSHYHSIVAPKALVQRNESIVVPFNLNKENQNMEKTKVVKRTCLTLEEIQDFFSKSNQSGQPETICSFPFLSGEYKLHLCVSEETLNVSVLKVVENDATVVPTVNQPVLSNKLDGIRMDNILLSEKCIQTSNNNSPVHSQTILPSSNVESGASQPDDNFLSIQTENQNPFPYLSKFFSDSESTPQLHTATDSHLITVENSSEVSPWKSSEEKSLKSPIQINETPLNSKLTTYKQFSGVSQNAEHLQEPAHTSVANVKNVINLSNENLPSTEKYKESNTCGTHENKIEVIDISSQNFSLQNVNSPISNKTVSGLKENTDLEAFFGNNKEYEDKQLQFTKNSVSRESCIQDNLPIQSTSTEHYTKMIEEINGLSSDPDMAFANDLVGPLETIAEKMNSKSRVSYDDEKSCLQSDYVLKTQRAKQVLSNPEEILTFITQNTSSNKNSNQKSSRLSLKLKKNSKFKRIQNYDSDSDSMETSKVDNSVKKQYHELKNNRDITLKTKDVTLSTFHDQSTLNSLFSDDAQNPSEIVKEIEDLDEKIKSVEEKLKQCGRADLISQENQILLKEIHGDDLDESNHSDSDDSEDSDDLFTSIPPTPPAPVYKDSNFKTSNYKH